MTTPLDMAALPRRADRVLGLGDLLGRPVRATVQGEPGRVIYEGWAGMEGVQPYDTGAEYVTREALASQVPDLVGAPVILGQRGRGGARLHPGQGGTDPAGHLVTARTALDAGAVGSVLDAEVRDLPDGRAGQWVRIAVHDADAIRAIDGGEATGLSSAYSVVLDASPGTYRGADYVARQTKRVGTHHLLLTDAPRAGAGATLRADAQEPPMPTLAEMDADQIKALIAEAVAASLKPMSDAMDGMKSMLDGMKPPASADAKVKIEGEPADPAMAAALEAAKADAAAQKSRADAAEAQVAALTLDKRRADAAPIAAALAARGLTVSGFDAANPTDAGIAAANAALAATLIQRADANGAPPSPPLVKPDSTATAPTPRALPL